MNAAIADFPKMAEDIGYTLMQIRELSELGENQIPFPYESGKLVYLGNSDIEGSGLFARLSLAPGDLICPAAIDQQRTPAGRYTNHSPNPNAQFFCTPGGNVDAYAMKFIQKDEEITVDYRQSKEAAMKAYFIHEKEKS